MAPKIILASTSAYRKQLLEKLRLPFECCNPDIDETPLANESPEALVLRLAKAKAAAGAKLFAGLNEGLVIGSDQVAVINGKIVGKPLNHKNAVKQLTAASGQAITFYTGLALHDIATNQVDSIVEPYTVYFRQLSAAQIERYVTLDTPFYCAGSFKSEGLGITLFEKMEGKDPNCLIGLPLISLVSMLSQKNALSI